VLVTFQRYHVTHSQRLVVHYTVLETRPKV